MTIDDLAQDSKPNTMLIYYDLIRCRNQVAQILLYKFITGESIKPLYILINFISILIDPGSLKINTKL